MKFASSETALTKELVYCKLELGVELFVRKQNGSRCYFNDLSCHEIRRRVSFPINSSSMLLLGSTEPKLDLRTGLLTLSQLQNSYNDQGLRAALDINILCIHLIPVRIRFQVVHSK